jgi:hypothetical protein
MTENLEQEGRSDDPAKCPNNSRHGYLIPYALGGFYCEECREKLEGTRARESWRFARPHA